MEPYQNGLLHKLKKSRAKFDDVNFSLSPVETAITSRRQIEFDAMFTDFFFNYGVCQFATLSANERRSENRSLKLVLGEYEMQRW